MSTLLHASRWWCCLGSIGWIGSSSIRWGSLSSLGWGSSLGSIRWCRISSVRRSGSGSRRWRRIQQRRVGCSLSGWPQAAGQHCGLPWRCWRHVPRPLHVLLQVRLLRHRPCVLLHSRFVCSVLPPLCLELMGMSKSGFAKRLTNYKLINCELVIKDGWHRVFYTETEHVQRKIWHLHYLMPRHVYGSPIEEHPFPYQPYPHT